MDILTLFRAQHPSLPLQEIDGIWYYKLHPSKTNWLPLANDTSYQQIKKCIESRKQSTTPLLFNCRCGVCHAYIMNKMLTQSEPKEPKEPVPNPFDSIPQAITQTKLIGFGKYAGQTYEWIYANDRKYCIWCIEKAAQERASSSSSEFLDFVMFVKQQILKN